MTTHLLSDKWRRMDFQTARRLNEAMRWLLSQGGTRLREDSLWPDRWVKPTLQMEIRASHLAKYKCVCTLVYCLHCFPHLTCIPHNKYPCHVTTGFWRTPEKFIKPMTVRLNEMLTTPLLYHFWKSLEMTKIIFHCHSRIILHRMFDCLSLYFST